MSVWRDMVDFMNGPYESAVQANGNGDGHKALADPAVSRREMHDQELGGAGNTSYQGLILDDYNPDLFGQMAIRTYDKMRKGDGQVRSTLRLVKTPLLAAEWYMEPASNSNKDKKAAELAWWGLNNTSRMFIQIIQEALLMLDYGYYMFEPVYQMAEYNGRPVATWKKFGPRHPRSVQRWLYDDHGGPTGFLHTPNNTTGETVTIKIEDLLIFTLDEESNDPQGISLLRSAYKHWYYKENLYKIDAIQKERHGIGIPRCELPPNYTPEDKRLANEMTKNLRTNEKSRVVHPPGFIVDFLELKGNAVDALDSARHHDMQIARNVLGEFLNIGDHTSGSAGSAATQVDVFIKSLHYVADLVRGVFNKWAIPKMIDYNMKVDAYPELKVRRVGDAVDWRALSVALRNLKESGILTPDSDFEEWYRSYMDLPRPSEEVMARTIDDRTAVKKQAPPTTDRVPKPADGA